MTDNRSRRNLLTTALGAVSTLGGCVFPPGADTQRSLTIDLLNVSERNGTYTITLRTRLGGQADNKPFRNVSVIVKNEAGEIRCRKPIGDVTEYGPSEPITFSCTEFPHTISYEIERDPCADDTSVKKMVYDSSEEDWIPSFIDC